MRWALLMLVCGCSSILGIEDFQVGDAGGGDGLASGFCLGPDGWKVCVPMAPTATVTLSEPVTFNTDQNDACLAVQPPSWKAAGQPDACFVVASSITVAAEVIVTGDRPLVLFAADSITIAKLVDVGSHLAGAQRGAGAPAAACKPPAQAASSAGGGAGGSFMTPGGRGGTGSITGSMAAGPANADGARPTKLRAGCNGSAGGDHTAAGGAAGRGGGAIYLVAGDRISVNAPISAAGSGGGAGGLVSGGGGGGSGGMIVLHAPTITGTNGVLVANGGGGGGGGGGNAIGMRGNETVATTPQTAARGGGGGGGGGAGGDGFAGVLDALVGANGALSTATGGGGGGGGGGYIATSVTASGIVTSPPAQTLN